jgi:integrase
MRRQAATKEGAVEKLNQLHGLGPLTLAQDRAITVEGWLRHWITNVAPAKVRSQQTLAGYRWAVERHLIPALGRRKLTNLSTEDVEVTLAERSATLSRNSLIRLRMVLAKAIDEAIRRNRINHTNIARYAVLPLDARPPKAGRSLTVEQARKLLEVANMPELPAKDAKTGGHPRPNHLGAMVVVGLMLGLRPGELTGLVWDDVDFKTRRLRVDKALVRGEHSILTRAEPKTHKSRRVVDMPAPVVDALRNHRSRQELRTVQPEADFVFKTSAGTPVDPSNLRRYFSELCEAAGLGHWTPRELRHSAVSLLSAAGVPIDHAADLMGHADTRMLDRHYRHATTKSYNAAVGPMERLFADTRHDTA